MNSYMIGWYALAAWIMALLYDRVETITGMEIHILLAGAIVTLMMGLYKVLYAKS